MKVKTSLVAIAAVCASSTAAIAQNKYDVFVGEFVAARHIASTCDGIAAVDVDAASNIAKSSNGLRKQKVLRILYYGKTAKLRQVGDNTLTARNVNPQNKKQVCRFGRQIIGKNDPIGRFLGAK